MLRHSRAMTRHHRERIIKKKKKQLDAIWINGWEGQTNNDLGRLAKHSWHHHACSMCTEKFKRNKWRYDESSFI